MTILNSDLLDTWKREFKKESGFDLFFFEEESTLLPRFSFDLSFKGLPTSSHLKEKPALIGEVTLVFYLYSDPYVYRKGQTLRAWELFTYCVFPFFSKRYGIRSKNFFMSSCAPKRGKETSHTASIGYCEFQLLKPFLLQEIL